MVVLKKFHVLHIQLRRRLQSASSSSHYEDLSSSAKTLSDYYTQEEMLQFRKPKKKKSLRKKEKLDLDALEAEAVSAGLGVGDLGSRKDGRRQASREEQEKIEAEMRKNAYQLAYAKAEEASRSLRVEQTLPVKAENDENMVIADDDEDLYKSLERARKLALKKQEEEGASGPKAIALRATSIPSTHNAENQSLATGESQESRVVMTEIEGFVSGLEVDEGIRLINSVLAWTICNHIFFLNCRTLILFSRFLDYCLLLIWVAPLLIGSRLV